MYYVDSIDLAQMLHYVSNQPITTLSNNISYQPAIRVILHPDEYKFPTDWVYILIIVIALLAVSFLASGKVIVYYSIFRIPHSFKLYINLISFLSLFLFSLSLFFNIMPLFEKVGMHWHLWRIRRRQRALYESGVIDMGAVLNTHPQSIKKVIDPASLSLFPTRIIDAHNQEEITTSNSSQEGHLENNDQQLHHESHEQVCVICLDEFSAGEQVRKLPCSHEFHTECIGKYITMHENKQQVPELFFVSSDPWLTIKSASCPLCKHDCYVKTETNDTEQSTSQPTPLLQPPRSSSPFFASLRPSSRSPSPAFGPTIPADRAEEFSRSWMARSLPRNMRRQIHEAAQAAAAAHQETVIELPARMTQPVEDLTIPVPPPPTAAASINNRTRLTNRFKDSLPRFLRSV